MRAPRLLPVWGLLALGVVLLAVVSSAQARTTRLTEFELQPGPGFQAPGGVAVDQATGNIYVIDEAANAVYVFGKEGGAPADGAPAVISGFNFARSFAEPTGIAVDNSCYFHVPRLSGESAECKKFDPSNGDLYVAATGAQMLEKLQLNGLTHEYEVVQSLPFPGLHGVAVDTQGNVYVARVDEQAITELTREGAEVKITQSVIALPVYVAVGAPGIIYVGGKGEEGGYDGQGVAKFAVNSHDEGELQQLGGQGIVRGGPTALDAQGNAFIDVESHVEEYNSTGEATGGFEFNPQTQILGGGGVAVEDETGDVAVGNLVYGPLIVQPEPSATAASSIEKATATLNGTILPEEEEAAYHFEYGPCLGSAGSCEEAEYPLETPAATIGPAGVGQLLPVQAAVSGLRPHTFYHYRLVAIAANDGAPQLRSSEEIFETAPAVHGVGTCTAPSSGVDAHGATLEALLEPLAGELPVEYRFEYGRHAPARPSEQYEHRTAAQRMMSAAEVGTVKTTVPGAGEAPLTPNATYHCRLVGLSEGFEAPGEDGTFTTSPAPPRVEATAAAPGLPARTAELLSGSVDPENSATTYYFAYIDLTGGEAGNAPNVTPMLTAGAGSAPVPVGPVRISGLRAGATYVYRLIAVNAAGEKAVGEEQAFTTAPATPPLVGAEQVSAITQTSASVTVAVNSQELLTSYELQLASSVSCRGGESKCGGAQAVYEGPRIFGAVPPGQETIAVALENLAVGTTYHVRVFASSEDGGTYGPDRVFTTLGVSSTITQPLGPVLLSVPAIAFPKEASNDTRSGRALTRTQKLHRALRACREKHSKKKRVECERKARKLYGRG